MLETKNNTMRQFPKDSILNSYSFKGYFIYKNNKRIKLSETVTDSNKAHGTSNTIELYYDIYDENGYMRILEEEVRGMIDRLNGVYDKRIRLTGSLDEYEISLNNDSDFDLFEVRFPERTISRKWVNYFKIPVHGKELYLSNHQILKEGVYNIR